MAAASDRPHGSFAAGARSDDPGFCELYKEYLDQDPAACAILGSRRVRNTRISGEFSLFDKVMRDESNKYKERLEGLECLGNEWLELLRFKQAYLVAISNDMNFSLTSANEDICIKAASHALKYLSVYPLAQVLLFARKKFDAMLAYLESMPPKRTIDMTEMSRLLYVCEAGWFSVKPKSLESIGRSNTPPLPVLVDVSAKEETSDTISGTPRPGYNGFILNSGAYHSATTKAKGNLANKDILMLSRADNGDTSSELTSSTLTGGNHQRYFFIPPISCC
uniref:Uncharacterized protein n=1 Tax=Arundo donax TaxID=35708 RepID=A0A0A9GHL0_ARUDO